MIMMMFGRFGGAWTGATAGVSAATALPPMTRAASAMAVAMVRIMAVAPEPENWICPQMNAKDANGLALDFDSIIDREVNWQRSPSS
jgi:hypothetical protein